MVVVVVDAASKWHRKKKKIQTPKTTQSTNPFNNNNYNKVENNVTSMLSARLAAAFLVYHCGWVSQGGGRAGRRSQLVRSQKMAKRNENHISL